MTTGAPAPTLADVVALLHGWFPPETAEEWDAVGLVLGAPEQPVRRILFAVDPVLPVAEEAAAWGADLLVVHHPLFLRAVHGVPATTPKGRTLHRLSTAGCALFGAHQRRPRRRRRLRPRWPTRSAWPTPSPWSPGTARPLDKVVTFVPVANATACADALAAAGARAPRRLRPVARSRRSSRAGSARGRVLPIRPSAAWGASRSSTRCVSRSVLPRARRSAVLQALLAAHPYEEPAWDLAGAR